MRLKPTKIEQRRYFNTVLADARLADGTEIVIGGEDDVHGGVTVIVGLKGEAYLLPYAAILKAVEEARRG